MSHCKASYAKIRKQNHRQSTVKLWNKANTRRIGIYHQLVTWEKYRGNKITTISQTFARSCMYKVHTDNEIGATFCVTEAAFR